MPTIRSKNGFEGDFESIDNTADIGVEDVDSKMIPDQILLSDYKRARGHSLQVRESCSVELTAVQGFIAAGGQYQRVPA